MQDTKKMLRDIETEVNYTRSMIGKDALNARVMQAMKKVPRHEFVPDDARAYAYANGPVPIGQGQTISQPYIVALMTDLLDPLAEASILEVGTGSGYQAAILSQLVKKVYSIEIVEGLAAQANERLHRLGYANIETRLGNGYFGWPEQGPFDGIIVTAAAPHIPQPLLDQLKPGARLVIPVGLPYAHQELIVVEKDSSGATHTRDVLPVAFVPLTGGREN